MPTTSLMGIRLEEGCSYVDVVEESLNRGGTTISLRGPSDGVGLYSLTLNVALGQDEGDALSAMLTIEEDLDEDRAESDVEEMGEIVDVGE